MLFVKFLKNLTACSLIILLVSCTTSSPPPKAPRSEAVKARLNLALAYLEQQDYPKAKENIDKAHQHDTHDYLPYSVMAYYYQQIGEPTSAEQAYQQALRLSDSRPDVLNNYGTFLCKQGQFQQAYQQFEQAVKSPEPYYHQADSLENIVLCAKAEPNQAKMQQALAQLEKLDQARAATLR